MEINGRRKSHGERSGGRAELIDKKPRFGRIRHMYRAPQPHTIFRQYAESRVERLNNRSERVNFDALAKKLQIETRRGGGVQRRRFLSRSI